MLRRLSRFECAFILAVLKGVFDGHAKLMNALCCGGRGRRPTVFRTHQLFFIIRSREFGCMEFFLVISFLIMGVI
jgi:hypothetical protein